MSVSMTRPGDIAAPRSPATGRIWPVLIVSFLCLNASIVGVTVYCAVGDKSAAAEPDYYGKALNYNETIRQRGENTRLGWRADPRLGPCADGRSVELVVMLADRNAAAVSGAEVAAEVFASIRSGQRQQVTLHARGPGEYAGPIGIDRSGVWNFRLRASRGGEVFTSDAEIFVPSPSR